MARNDVAVDMRVRNRKLGGDLGKSRSMFKRAFKNIGRGIKGSLGKIFSPLGIGLGALGIGAIGKEVVEFETGLTRLGIQSSMSAEQIDKLRRNMVSMSDDTGIARGKILGGATALVNLLGSAGLTTRKLRLMADASDATGASMKDLGGLVFSLEKAFKLKGAKQLQIGLSRIITAGKEGAVPLNEMTMILQQVSSSFTELGGTGVDSVADLATAIQILRPAFGSAAETGTGLQSLMTAMAKKAKELRKAGLEVFVKDPVTGIKRFKAFRQVLDDFANNKLLRDPELMVKALGRVEAKKAATQLRANLKDFDKLRAATVKGNAVMEDSVTFRNSAAGKFSASMNKVKESIAKSFTPARIEKFAELMEKVSVFVGFIADNLLLTASVFATIKVGGFLLAMRGAATASAATATSTALTATAANAAAVGGGRFALAMKAAKIATLGIGAAIAGFEFGKFLDKKFKLSDKLAKGLETSGTEDVDQGFLRDRLKTLRGATSRLLATGEAGLSTDLILKQARGAVRAGKQTGSITTENPEDISVERISKKTVGLISGRLDTFGPDRLATQELKDAAKLLKDAAEANAKGLRITIGVDESSRTLVIKTVKGDDNKVRRSTQ